MFKNITIKSRLILVIGFLSLQLIVGTLIGINSLSFSNDAAKAIYTDRLTSRGPITAIVAGDDERGEF